MLKLIKKAEISALITLRDFETKIGQNLTTGSVNELYKKGVKYVLLGVEESIGPRANLGNLGAENAWNAFLKSFVNVQDNHFINQLEIGVLGSFKFNSDHTNVDLLRALTEVIDKELAIIIEQIAKKKMIPILIGGGHNNALPLLTGIAKAYGTSLNAINCDPHADFRPLEGRHSGNGFSYAMARGFLEKYFILGLHQSYNGKSIFKKFDEFNKNEKKIMWTYFDDWIYGKSTMENDIETGIKFIKDRPIGLELDMDSIAYMPSSASGPSGIQLNEARRYISKCASSLEVAYLHLTEAAPTNELEYKMVGKSLAYLVSDFLKNLK